jgi:hypothetical protein
MTTTQVPSSQLPDSKGLGPVLDAAHKVWIAETDGYLNPIILREAPFWERWTAVRYLADEFMAQYRRERALLEELRPFLPGGVAQTLLDEGDGIEQLQQELDRIGRRRGTAQPVSRAARLLRDAVRAWCANIESAAREIDRSELPEEARRVLASFELYTQVHT